MPYKNNKLRRVHDRVYQPIWRARNPEKMKQYSNNAKNYHKKYYEENKDKLKTEFKKYRESNKIELKLKKKIYYNKNREGILKYNRERFKRIYKHNPLNEERKKLMLQKQKETWNKPEMKEYARQRRIKQILPIKDTKIEVKIQNFLKALNIEFFTHQYIKEIEHGYQCDILIPSKKCIIECFGTYWHKYPYANERDIIRCKELREKGYKVLVLWENEIRPMRLSNFRDKLIQYKIIK